MCVKFSQSACNWLWNGTGAIEYIWGKAIQHTDNVNNLINGSKTIWADSGLFYSFLVVFHYSNKTLLTPVVLSIQHSQSASAAAALSMFVLNLVIFDNFHVWNDKNPFIAFVSFQSSASFTILVQYILSSIFFFFAFAVFQT